MDVELHQEAGGGVVSTEEGVDGSGVETRDDEDPDLHLGPLPGGTGDQPGATVVNDDIGEGLDRCLKHLLREIGYALRDMFLGIDPAKLTGSGDFLGKVSGGYYPTKASASPVGVMGTSPMVLTVAFPHDELRHPGLGVEHGELLLPKDLLHGILSDTSLGPTDTIVPYNIKALELALLLHNPGHGHGQPVHHVLCLLQVSRGEGEEDGELVLGLDRPDDSGHDALDEGIIVRVLEDVEEAAVVIRGKLDIVDKAINFISPFSLRNISYKVSGDWPRRSALLHPW